MLPTPAEIAVQALNPFFTAPHWRLWAPFDSFRRPINRVLILIKVADDSSAGAMVALHYSFEGEQAEITKDRFGDKSNGDGYNISAVDLPGLRTEIRLYKNGYHREGRGQ